MLAHALQVRTYVPERATAREDAATRRPMSAREDTIAGTHG